MYTVTEFFFNFAFQNLNFVLLKIMFYFKFKIIVLKIVPVVICVDRIPPTTHVLRTFFKINKQNQ